jgi:CRP-like cAMP-binding protein
VSAGHSLLPHLQSRKAPLHAASTVSVDCTPRQNKLLAALPQKEYERLLPDLEPVALPRGSTIHGPGDRQNYLYFLTAGIVSRLNVAHNGASTEFALTGREGVIGVASFLGGELMPSLALVLSDGLSYRLSADLLPGEFKHGGLLSHLLLRYTQALITQTGQVAVCNRLHSVEQQLCRWILSFLDRSPTDELLITQEVIADLLGVRRESVTEAAGRLQDAGMIRYSRGKISAPDRRRLEAQVCECYAVVRREYERLLGPARTVGLPPRSGCRETACLADHGA